MDTLSLTKKAKIYNREIVYFYTLYKIKEIIKLLYYIDY